MTVTVHDVPAVTVAPESARLLPPLAAVTVAPTQVLAPDADAVFARPAGYVSVNVTPVTSVALPLVRVIVSTDVPLVPIAAGAKPFATPRPARTVRFALAAAADAPAFVVTTPPIGIVFA